MNEPLFTIIITVLISIAVTIFLGVSKEAKYKKTDQYKIDFMIEAEQNCKDLGLNLDYVEIDGLEYKTTCKSN